MPTYNEAENIKKMVDELFDIEFPKINAQMHLLIVDDNSPDGTGEIVKEKMRRYKNLHLLTGEKQGLGTAYTRGMKYAMEKLDADAVIEMDADFQHDPKHLKAMVGAYLDGADYVIGSRYIPGGSIPTEWELHRKLVSFFGNLFARVVLWLPKLHDITTGFRLTKVDGVLNKIDLANIMELKRFAYKIDLFYKSVKLAKKVVEIPIHFASRKMEKSKFNPKEMVASYKVVILLRLKESERFIKFGTVGFIGFAVNYIGLELLKRAGLTTYWATLFATELAIISNFILNNVWTFKDKIITKVSEVVIQFVKFNFSSLFAVIVQPLIVSGAAAFFGDTSLVRLIALVFALIFVIIPYNYAVYNIFIWKTWKIPILSKFQKS